MDDTYWELEASELRYLLEEAYEKIADFIKQTDSMFLTEAQKQQKQELKIWLLFRNPKSKIRI